jgi:hypothetical protein
MAFWNLIVLRFISLKHLWKSVLNIFTVGEKVRLNQYIHDCRNFYISAMFHLKMHKFIVFVSLRLLSIENIYIFFCINLLFTKLQETEFLWQPPEFTRHMSGGTYKSTTVFLIKTVSFIDVTIIRLKFLKCVFITFWLLAFGRLADVTNWELRKFAVFMM